MTERQLRIICYFLYSIWEAYLREHGWERMWSFQSMFKQGEEEAKAEE